MLRFAAIFSIFSVGTPICGAEPHPASGQNQESWQHPPRPVEQPLLKKVFRSQYNKEQLAQFKEAPTLEQLAQSMSPEQRQAARAGLAGLEAKARTPDELAQIARGYLMLDEQEPDRGQDVFRVAARLELLDPGSPAAPTLAAEAFFRMGDYPSATKVAEEALKRNRDDPGANAIYNLSVGRSATGKEKHGVSSRPSASPADAQEALTKHLDFEQTIKPVVQGKRNPIVVPSSVKADSGAASEKPNSLPPLPLAMAVLGLAFVGYGVYRARKSVSPEDSSVEPSVALASATRLATEVPAPQVKETTPSQKGILDIADRYVAGAKTFVQDHPIASATAAIVALAIIIRVGGPIIAAGGGVAAGTEIVAGSGGAATLGRATAKVLPTPTIEAWWARTGAAVGAVSALLMEGGGKDSSRTSEGQPNDGTQKIKRHTTRDFKNAVRRLKIDEHRASNALHKAKRSAGRKGGANVEFDTKSGDIISPETGEVIGNLFE
ncbi:MAG: hypothetical protein HY924_09855 [Elusimicrobia bacterium]|nr:hypothetical protein [Elusimicrobiota bacterium]